MKIRVAILAGVLLVLVLSGALFVVDEGELALVIRLGEVAREPIMEPGLHVKLPLIERVERFNARILPWDGDAARIPIKDSNFLFVDSFARWRISDPKRFYNAVRDMTGAKSRLDDVLDSTVRDVVSDHFVLELVRSTDRPLDTVLPEPAEEMDIEGVEGVEGVEEVLEDVVPEDVAAAVGLVAVDPDVTGRRIEVRREIFESSRRKLEELDIGVELMDLRIKRLDYTPLVREQVYARMISEQQRIAERYRAQGQGKKAEITGLTEQEQRRILSEAYRTAQETVGEAEAESTRIYARAYNQDPDLYRLIKSLETYGAVLGERDTLILSTDSDLLRYLKTLR